MNNKNTTNKQINSTTINHDPTLSYIKKTDIKIDSVILLTGASSGLGKQLAMKLAKMTVTLVITGRNKQRLQQTKQICESYCKAKIQAIQADLSQQSSCKNLVGQVVQKYGQINVLILNAGINAHFHFYQLKDLSVYDKLMKTNFYANVYLTRYALNYVKKVKGFIVVINSISGKLGLPQRSAYCASKFALTGFFQSLRTQQQNISICMVYPTSLDTPMRNNDIMGAKQASHQSKNKQQSAQKTAQFIIANIKKGQKDIYIPNKLWLGTVMQPLFPNFMRNKIKQAAKL